MSPDERKYLFRASAHESSVRFLLKQFINNPYINLHESEIFILFT